MTIRIEVLKEPMLEFGDGASGVEPRLVMKKSGAYMNFGGRKKTIELGLICLRDEVEPIKRWIASMGKLLVGEEANAERFREFPGSEKVFKCDFAIPEHFIRVIEPQEYALQAAKKPSDRFEGMLDLFSRKADALFDDVRPEVVLIGFHEDDAEFRVANPKLSAKERAALDYLQKQDDAQTDMFAPDPDELKRMADLKPHADELLYRNFYRALKARLMQKKNAVPVQILRQHTYREDKAGQSAATRAWNLGVSLFYKAGNIPWRPRDLPANFCFVGISFHHLKRQGGDLMYASVAQAMSSTGQPFVLKGTTVPSHQIRHKQPYLTEVQASDLIRRVIDAYEGHAGVKPDRVVIHKTSRYQLEEMDGFRSAMQSVPAVDLIWLSQTGFRLVKKGAEEVWRGTLVDVEGRDHYLFSTGFVPWWKEYPGPHIPSPIQFGSAFETDLHARALEILALTKMNWNSSDGLARFPVTISFARRVGMVMTELAEDDEPNSSYRFYM
jgi:hypothetical protein